MRNLLQTFLLESTDLFSSFRGNSVLTVATLLALAGDPKARLKETLHVYDLLKAARFHASDYLVVAACQIAAQAEPERYVDVVRRAKAFYDALKSAHWFLAGQDDHIYAAMFGLSNQDVQSSLYQTEILYHDLKVDFHQRNSLLAMAIVLMLAGQNRDSAQRVSNLKTLFRDRHLIRYSPSMIFCGARLALARGRCQSKNACSMLQRFFPLKQPVRSTRAFWPGRSRPASPASSSPSRRLP